MLRRLLVSKMGAWEAKGNNTIAVLKLESITCEGALLDGGFRKARNFAWGVYNGFLKRLAKM